MQPETFKSLVRAAAEQVIASAPELTALDQAIGDGDHGANMKRGFEAVLGKLDTIGAQPLDEALKTIGKTLVMTVGGASGPLYGSFFMAAGEALSHDKRLPDDLAEVFALRRWRGERARPLPARREDDARRFVPGAGDIEGRCGAPRSDRAGSRDRERGGRANGADAGDQGPGLVSRCAQRRACRSRRAIKLRPACMPSATRLEAQQ